jgi:hypothetical protein
MAKITIPKKDWEVFLELFLLDSERKKAFLEVIKDPVNVPHTDDFAKYFAAKTGWNRKKSSKAIEVLFKLYNLYDNSGENIDSIVTAIIDSFKEIEKKEIEEAIDIDIKSFKSFLREVLSLYDTLGVRAKAYRLMPQHQHIFRRSEIYSDIRAVFRPDKPEIKPSAAVIVHSLKIDYYEDYEDKAFYFGLSYNDLQQLKNTIERAIKKHECLKRVIVENCDIQCLEEEE